MSDSTLKPHTRAQGDEEGTRIALQRKQTHQADTWREMCTIPVSTGQQADDLLVSAKRASGVGGGMGKLIENHKDGRDNEADGEDEDGEEDMDLPQGTR